MTKLNGKPMSLSEMTRICEGTANQDEAYIEVFRRLERDFVSHVDPQSLLTLMQVIEKMANAFARRRRSIGKLGDTREKKTMTASEQSAIWLSKDDQTQP